MFFKLQFSDGLLEKAFVDKSISLSRSIVHFFTLMMRPIADHVTYTVRSGVAAGLKRRGGYGFLPFPVRSATKRSCT